MHNLNLQRTVSVLILAATPWLGVAVVKGQPNADAISKGYASYMKWGLQINAFTFAEENGFSPAYFTQSNFTGVTIGGDSDYRPANYGPKNSFDWNIVGSNASTQVQDSKLPYFNTLKTWSYQDEQDLTIPSIVTETANWMSAMRADPRVPADTLLYVNQWGQQTPEAAIQAYMAIAKPDQVSFDWYVFGTGYPQQFVNGSPRGLYFGLEKYRRLGMAGNDGTGQHPIPYGHWLSTFVTTRDHGLDAQAVGYRMSDSEMRLDQFAGWAFGAKFATAFTYDSANAIDSLIGPLLFSSGGADAVPTQQFHQLAEINRESRNLGPALVRLLSTNVQRVRGPNSFADDIVPAFDATSDQYLKGVVPTNLGTHNGGAPGDVVLGWLKPLISPVTLTGNIPDNETYFMVVNGLVWTNTSAADTAQTIHLNFDFGTSGITSLQRLSRDTGLVEIVPLVPDGGSLYHLDLTLPGGTGDLFKYNTGAVFLVPEPGCIGLLLLAGAFLKRATRRVVFHQ